MLGNLTVKAKLWLAMGLLLGLMVVVGGSNILSTRKISGETDVIDKTSYPLALSSMNLQLWVERAMATINEAASASRQDLLINLEDIEKPLFENMSEVKQLASRSPEIRQDADKIEHLYEQAKKLGLKWVEASLNEQWGLEPQYARNFYDKRGELETAIMKIKEDGGDIFSDSVSSITDLANDLTLRTLFVCLTGTIICLILAFLVSRSITKPIARLLAVIQEIREDKTSFARKVEIISRDEIGQLGRAFNAMLDDLEHSRQEVSEYTDLLESKVEKRTAQLNEEKEALRESEKHLKAIWDSTPSGLVIVDAQSHQILAVNPHALELMGREEKDVIGQVCHSFMCPAEKGKCPITDLKQTADRSERLLLCSDKKKLPILKTVVSMTKQNREYLIESFVDITERKDFEDKLEKLNLELEGRVEKRTAELEKKNNELETEVRERQVVEKALKKAKEEAEAASQAKGDFLANMSHEIRTPLNAIIGMTEVTLGTALTREQEEYLDTVRLSSESLLTLLNDILDFSKIEARQLKLDEIDFDLRASLENVTEMLAVRADETGVELSCHIKPNVPTALAGDPVRLRQIVVNLTQNAIKFTEQGQVSISVEAEKETDTGVLLHFKVSDSGIGIPPDKIDAIFDTFSQGDSSTTRRYGGTGLGLSISKQLVEMMDGNIWVESEIGKGSTFHFTARFGFARKEPTEDFRIKELSLSGIPVLILDDKPRNTQILLEMTSSWGLDPAVAKDQSEALLNMERAADSGNPYRILLLDCQLKGADGFEVGKRIKGSRSGQNVKVILLTSIGQKGDAAQCIKSGISGYLVKPVRQSELLDAIIMALGGESDERVSLITRHSVREAQKRLNILIVEDNVVNQKVAAAMLKKRGHRFTLAADGRQALEALSEGGYDLVLMDVQMPEMDGIEATRIMRENERVQGGHIPIVAMTARAMKGDREECLAAGMDDYISKPIRDADLVSVIDKFACEPHKKRQLQCLNRTQDSDSSAQEVFDLSEAMKSVSGDKALFSEIANLFLESAADNMSKIRRGIASSDAGAVETAAHALKGSVSNFGAKRAFDAAYRLECMGKEGKLTEALNARSELEKELEALEAAMKFALQE